MSIQTRVRANNTCTRRSIKLVDTLIEGQLIGDDFGSTTPLSGSGGATPSFTSGVVSNYGANGPIRRVVGSVYTDQAGTLQVEGSVNGTTWRNVGSSVAVTASTLQTFDQVVYHPLTRVVLTNTQSSAQTVLELSISTRPN